MSDTSVFDQPLVFGLDIGTRNVVGTVGYRTEDQFIVTAQYIMQHDTRAMLDGQIHDIGRVSGTIRKVKEQLEKQKTKIDYLQLQIRPHFYINCLNSIYSMAQLKHTEEIQQLALYVSGYMRSIFRKGTKPILMDEELQQIVNYVKIHNILYRYDCKCHICVDERVKQAMIPPLIMIVFVENCVKYTVGCKRKIEISIEGSFLDEEQKKIQIRIADNGPGFPENVLEKFRKNEFGANDDRFQIGIRNTKDRLQLLYGAEASLMIGNGENLGTEVIIIIPYQNGDEKSEYSISR